MLAWVIALVACGGKGDLAPDDAIHVETLSQNRVNASVEKLGYVFRRLPHSSSTIGHQAIISPGSGAASFAVSTQGSSNLCGHDSNDQRPAGCDHQHGWLVVTQELGSRWRMLPFTMGEAEGVGRLVGVDVADTISAIVVSEEARLLTFELNGNDYTKTNAVIEQLASSEKLTSISAVTRGPTGERLAVGCSFQQSAARHLIRLLPGGQSKQVGLLPDLGPRFGCTTERIRCRSSGCVLATPTVDEGVVITSVDSVYQELWRREQVIANHSFLDLSVGEDGAAWTAWLPTTKAAAKSLLLQRAGDGNGPIQTASLPGGMPAPWHHAIATTPGGTSLWVASVIALNWAPTGSEPVLTVGIWRIDPAAGPSHVVDVPIHDPDVATGPAVSIVSAESGSMIFVVASSVSASAYRVALSM